jgi:hypothetical protein
MDGAVLVDAFAEMMRHVNGPSRFCAGMLHNLCALMLGLGEDRKAIERLLTMVLDNIEEYERK